MNTVWIAQGLDDSQSWETILVDDTWAGLLGKFNRLQHKNNWTDFRVKLTGVK
jgi:hypothetical protein